MFSHILLSQRSCISAKVGFVSWILLCKWVYSQVSSCVQEMWFYTNGFNIDFKIHCLIKVTFSKSAALFSWISATVMWCLAAIVKRPLWEKKRNKILVAKLYIRLSKIQTPSVSNCENRVDDFLILSNHWLLINSFIL